MKLIKEMIMYCRKLMHSFVTSNPKRKRRYLDLATRMSNFGLTTPLSMRAKDSLNRWAIQGQQGSADNPDTYSKEDKSLPELFRDVLPYLSKDSKILEIGCNVGRSLNYLHGLGYHDLTGIEIGQVALDKAKVFFPEMAKTSTLICGNAPEVLKTLKSASYDLVFCHSVLVNIPLKYNYIFKEMARISKKYILILENEGSLFAYTRDFKRMFERNGMKMIVLKIFTGACEKLAVEYDKEIIFSNNTIRLFTKDNSR